MARVTRSLTRPLLLVLTRVQKRSQWRMSQMARGGQLHLALIASVWLCAAALLALFPIAVIVDRSFGISSDAWSNAGYVWVLILLVLALLRMVAALVKPVRTPFIRTGGRPW